MIKVLRNWVVPLLIVGVAVFMLYVLWPLVVIVVVMLLIPFVVLQICKKISELEQPPRHPVDDLLDEIEKRLKADNNE